MHGAAARGRHHGRPSPPLRSSTGHFFNSRPPDPRRQDPHRPFAPPPPPFRVLLLRAAGSRFTPSMTELEDLISSCDSPPKRRQFLAAGPSCAVLYFDVWSEALDASANFWRLRLDGIHRLVPAVESSSLAPTDREEEKERLRDLFVTHARALLDCELIQRCEAGIEDAAREVGDLNKLLRRKHNSLKVFEDLRAKKQKIEEKKEEMENRLGEFRAAIGCILGKLGEPKVGSFEDEGAGFELLNVQEFDWERIHYVLARERRRLEDGLPIYACRRKILKTFESNQVTVLIGETGSGKSTQIVQYLLDSGLSPNGAIICTQPRKIAAMSLAARVEEESSGCYDDYSVKYDPYYSSSEAFHCKIIYMTDYCLLQHCMNKKNVAGISYIIVDEAHERSLNTDLLIAFLKRHLLEVDGLRVIIMSATADATRISEYFFGCCIFNVKGRTYPVEISYVPDVYAKASGIIPTKEKFGACPSYVSEVIQMVNVIHKTEDPGAILAFLTSPMEVELACEHFDDPSAVKLPLHGKLSYEEQNNVFKKYPGKRKVIFSTNIAETSLTIADVRYVVDSGMVKESKYEPSSCMNVVKVCWISQSSANQRAGRAGRTNPGKCYRIYSEKDFQMMRAHQEPEILNVHLGIAVLRILSFGIRNVQDFDFIDAPSPEAVSTAVKSLVRLGALVSKNGAFEVTDTGRYLAKLGIEPRLGKIILDCFKCGLRKEGLVLAAVMTQASSIFCRVGTEEEKLKADCFRVPFCHPAGDLFTLLSVYKRWEEECESKAKWCWHNRINAKSLRRCEDTVLELENVLRKELNIIIPCYWLWNPHEPSKHDRTMKRIILSSLIENTAMYCGHEGLGYEVVLTGQRIRLHPSCSLLVYDQKPSWVVFSEILLLSTRYLVCVTAVDYDSLYSIRPPLFDVSRLESRKMQVTVISGLGENLLRRFCGKQNRYLEHIASQIKSDCKDDRIAVNVDFDKREFQLLASAKDLEKVSSFVNDAIRYETKWLRDECIVRCLSRSGSRNSPFYALFGSGAEIKHLELRKRCLAVEIFHKEADALEDKELLVMVDRHAPGIVDFCKNMPSGSELPNYSRWGQITFGSPESALKAMKRLDNLEFQGSMLKILPVCCPSDHQALPFPAVKARVSWPRRPSRGLALVRCEENEVENIVSDFIGLELNGHFLRSEVSFKNKDCVFVSGIPRDVFEPELYDTFRRATKRRIFDIVLIREQAVNESPSAFYSQVLDKEIAPFMPKRHFVGEHFLVEVLEPEMKHSMVKANITFDGNLHLEAAQALDHIQGRALPGCLPWQKVQCQRMFHSSLSCPARVYVVIRKQLHALLESFKCQKGASCKLEKTESGSCRVCIWANATRVVANLRRPLEQLMKGKTISHASLTPSMMQMFLSRDGLSCLKRVEQDTGTCIIYERKNLSVRVFGPPDQVAEAEKKLVQSLVSIQESKQLEIRLRGSEFPPGLMKEVIHRFGPDLHGLKETVPGVELVFNIRNHILSVKGNKEQKRHVEQMIAQVAETLDNNNNRFVQQITEESLCPICFCELEDPYKLEACRHDFCSSCLLEQFESAIKSRDGFPVRCSKEGCGERILVVDMKSLLSPDKLEELFRASLMFLVMCNSGSYRFCPTPDCTSVYEVAPPRSSEPTPYLCPVCQVETCTSCHLEHHPLTSCETYKTFKEDPDQSLEAWRKGKQEVKDCPSCHQTIEKLDGCNHIECKCKVHICWECLETFATGGECYQHIEAAHVFQPDNFIVV